MPIVVARLHAGQAVRLQMARMKDYYDVWMLTSAFEIDPTRLRRAIAATFSRRNTMIPTEVPDGLSEAFAADPGKQRQWVALRRIWPVKFQSSAAW